MGAVDDLIAGAKAEKPPRLSEAVAADIKRMMDLNDAGVCKRITEQQARDAIKKDHGVSMGATKFYHVVMEMFGRSWGGR